MLLETINSSKPSQGSKVFYSTPFENAKEEFNKPLDTINAMELLQESKVSYQTLLDNSFDAIISIDAEGLIKVWNHRAESMFGWKAEEVIGKALTQTIIPPSFHEAHTKGLKNFLAKNESRVLNQKLELTAIHRKGNEFPIEIFIWATYIRNKVSFTALIKDITENKNFQKEMRLKNAEYKVLHQVAQVLQNSKSMEEMLHHAMEVISQSKELHVENKAGVFLVDEEKNVLRLASTLGNFPKGFLENQAEIPFYNVPYGRCYSTGEIQIKDYCQFKPHRLGPFGNLANYGTYIIPLKSKAKVVGILFLYTPETPPCYEGSTEILMSIGSLMGNAIQQRKYEKKIHEQNKKLNKLNELKNKFLGIA